jgi:hypothetical protein
MIYVLSPSSKQAVSPAENVQLAEDNLVLRTTSGRELKVRFKEFPLE